MSTQPSDEVEHGFDTDDVSSLTGGTPTSPEEQGSISTVDKADESFFVQKPPSRRKKQTARSSTLLSTPTWCPRNATAAENSVDLQLLSTGVVRSSQGEQCCGIEETAHAQQPRFGGQDLTRKSSEKSPNHQVLSVHRPKQNANEKCINSAAKARNMGANLKFTEERIKKATMDTMEKLELFPSDE